MSRYTLHARSGLLIAGLLLLPAALVAAEGEAAVPTVKIEPQLRARSHASEATIEAVRQATVAAQVQGRVLEARVDAGARVRRGDVDMLGTDHLVIQLGDRLRVVAPRDRIAAVSAHLGDSARGLSDINPIGFAFGLAIGVGVGLIHIPAPGGGFTLGAAAGTLLVGLVFGRLVRVGPLVVSMSTSSATSLSTFGMITFLAYAGSRAGERFVGSVTSDLGWKVLVLGALLTTAAAVAITVVGRTVLKTNARQLAGVIAGAQTQPAVLAFANDRTGFDPRVGLGYALVYPAAMIAKILLAQVIAGL